MFIELAWLIPLIMFLAALINGLGCKKLGKVAGYISVGAMLLCCVLSFLIFAQVWSAVHENHSWTGERIMLWNWFDLPNFFGSGRHFIIDMAFKVDQLTSVFLCFISFIGTLVFIYATGYMKEKHDGKLELDPGYARFFAYVALFAASMFTLILGDNMAVMFIGWEGVGLCSYLLIGYYFEKPFSETLSCSDAGRKAFVMNRIGDAGLIVGMGLIFWGLGTVNFSEINNAILSGQLPSGESIPAGFKYGGVLVTAATLCMFLGATGKSAQIPLFTWLPDAMAGPTPVSALIHAATMVTAGIYMVARLNLLYFISPTTMAVIAVIGGLTAFAAASMALFQRGIKKILAYSTVSQLGYMFLGLGVGAMAGGIFHVFTHAFFKGCLFLAAGSVIHAMHHEEDVFKMGGLKKYMPMTWLAYLFATLAIAGFPLTAGFFSKDEILFSAFIASNNGLPFLWVLGALTALMTAFYMGRSLFLAFHGSSDRIDPHVREHLHESPKNMTSPILILGVLGLIVGFMNVPAGLSMIPVPKAQFHHFIAPVVDLGAEYVAEHELNMSWEKEVNGSLVVAATGNPEMTSVELAKSHKKLEVVLAIVSSVIAILGLAGAFVLYGKGLPKAKVPGFIREASLNSWWWDAAYNKFFKDGTMALSRGVWKFDTGIVDGIVIGIAEYCRGLGELSKKLQSGRVQAYGLIMVIGVSLFIVYFAIGLSSFLDEAYEYFQPETKNPATTSVIMNEGIDQIAIIETDVQTALNNE